MSNDNDDDDDDGRTGQQKHNLKTSNKQTKSNIGDAKKREKKWLTPLENEKKNEMCTFNISISRAYIVLMNEEIRYVNIR